MPAAETDARKVKLLCSFGGGIRRRPTDGALRYAGGSNRLVSIRRSASLLDLSTGLSRLLPPPFSAKYQLPGEDLDALVSVSTQEDLDNMMDEFDRIDELSGADGSARIRLFLFSPSDSDQELFPLNADIGESGGYFDAINGGSGTLLREGTSPGLSRLGFFGEGSPPEKKKTLVSSRNGHQEFEFLNPNDNAVDIPLVDGNLNRSQDTVKSLPVENPKTNQEEVPQRVDAPQEENLLVENVKETLISTRIDQDHVRNVPMGVSGVYLNPNQGTVEPCSEENACRSEHDYFYTNNGRGFYYHQPSYIMPLPLSYVSPLSPRLQYSLWTHTCQMCQRALPCHSDVMVHEQGNGNGNGNGLGSSMIPDAALGLMSQNFENPLRLQAAHRSASVVEPGNETYPSENQKAACTNLESSDHAKMLYQPGTIGVVNELVRVQAPLGGTTGGLNDSLVEPKVPIAYASGQLPGCGFVPKPHDNECLVHMKVEALGAHSRVFAPPGTMALSSEAQLANHLTPAHHEGSLQQLPQTSSKQVALDGSPVKNVKFPATEVQSRVSVPEVSYDYVTPINGMMEGLHVSTSEPTSSYEQQRPDVAVNVGTQRDIGSGYFPGTEALSQVSVPELTYEYARPINGMMEGTRVNTFEPTGFFQQQRPAVAVYVGTPGDLKSENLPVIENYAIRSQIGGNAEFIGNAFANPVMVPEGNSVITTNKMLSSSVDLKPELHPSPAVGTNGSVRPQVVRNAVYPGNGFVSSGMLSEGKPARPVNHLPPPSTDSTLLSNLQPSETFQVSALMANHGPPLSYSQEMIEPEVPIDFFLGMSTYSGVTDPACSNSFNSNTIRRIHVGDWKDEASRSCLKDVNNIPAPPSANISNQDPTSSCHTEHVEQFQASISSNSVFSNLDPHQFLKSTKMVDKDSSKEFVFPINLASENHQVYSNVLHPSEDGSFNQTQISMTKDPCLRPVQFSQGEEHKKDDLHSGTEQVVASLLQSVPSVPGTFSHERKESDTQTNKESRLVGNTSSQNAMALGEHKVEDSKTKQSDTMSLGPPVTDNIGRLQIIKNCDLEELRELGSGTFGTVYHGKWRGSDVAIKRISNRFFAGKPSEEERMRADFWNEACKLADLHHPNVVSSYGVVLDGPEGSYATVTEFMVDGSLRQALHKNDRSIDRGKRLLIAMDVAFGMEYLHGKNIVHFDLKSDNLLVNLKDPQRPICKIADLGLSKVKCKTLISGGVIGTLPWMAPELLNGSSCLVSEKVDVFSFGIVMWELLTGEEPYADLHYGAIIGGIISKTLRPPVPEFCDPDWRSLMEQCWSSSPSGRPSFTEVASRLRSMAGSPPKG